MKTKPPCKKKIDRSIRIWLEILEACERGDFHYQRVLKRIDDLLDQRNAIL